MSVVCQYWPRIRRRALILQGNVNILNVGCMQPGYIDDRFGPLGLATVVVLALTAIFIVSVTDFVLEMKAH